MTGRSKATRVARDQTPTPFGGILARLLRHCPGVKAAALIDPEGETVDYAGQLPDYFTKLVSAHFRIVIDDVATRLNVAHLGNAHQLTVRADAWTFTVRRLPDGYALVIIFQRRAFTLSARALSVCDEELSREAGWVVAAPALGVGTWFPQDVEPARRDRRRPGRVRIGDRWHGVDILGRVVGLRRDRAYRCRLSTGAEVTLVREPSGQWFTEERLVANHPSAPGAATRPGSRRRAVGANTATKPRKKGRSGKKK